MTSEIHFTEAVMMLRVGVSAVTCQLQVNYIALLCRCIADCCVAVE